MATTTCPPHNYTPAGDIYNKSSSTTAQDGKSYRVVYCAQCGDTKEIVVANRGAA